MGRGKGEEKNNQRHRRTERAANPECTKAIRCPVVAPDTLTVDELLQKTLLRDEKVRGTKTKKSE